MTKKRILLACILFMLFLPSLTASSQNLALGYEEENEYGNLSDMPLEMAISRRMSAKGSQFYSDAEVSWETISKVLWAAYGYSSLGGRTVPSLCGDYPIIIYFCNTTACYSFVPETQSLTLWKHGDYRALGGGHMAPTMLYLVINTDLCDDVYWGNAESGSAIQNIYLMANALNLGTVCMGGTWLNRTYIHQQLGLPENENVLYKMPLGYMNSPYTDYENLVPTSRPSSQELPEIRDSNVSIDGALDSVFSSHEWSENPITKQELSQLLWAGYGYSYYEDTAASSHPMNIIRHRTVPSARAKYPMIIYAANSSGTFKYIPYEHTMTMIGSGDKRADIAAASEQAWMSTAPLIIILTWNDTRIYNLNTTYTEVGLITQNIYLESAAWGLIADWGRADANEEAMREALGLTGETHVHPASVIAVGHQDTTPPTISILSPENKTYTFNDIPLTFTINEATSWIGYSLDSQMNMTASGNMTLSDLSEGSHSLVVYSNDTAGNMGASSTVYFTIDTNPPNITEVSQTPRKNNVLPEDKVKINATVTDDLSGVKQVSLNYTNGNGTWITVEMTNLEGTIWNATTPAFPYCTNVTYMVIAADNVNNTITTEEMGYEHQYHVIPEFTSFLLLSLFMMATLLAVIVYRGKQIGPSGRVRSEIKTEKK